MSNLSQNEKMAKYGLAVIVSAGNNQEFILNLFFRTYKTRSSSDKLFV
jgi:hypothetical protein